MEWNTIPFFFLRSVYYKHKSICYIRTMAQEKRIHSVLSAFSHSGVFICFVCASLLCCWCWVVVCCFFLFVRRHIFVHILCVYGSFGLSDISEAYRVENRETSWRAELNVTAVLLLLLFYRRMYLSTFSNSNKQSTSTKGSGIGRSLRDVFIFVCLHVIRIRCVRKHLGDLLWHRDSSTPMLWILSLSASAKSLSVQWRMYNNNATNKNTFLCHIEY